MEHRCYSDRRTSTMLIQVMCVTVVLFGVATGFNLDKVNFLRFNGPRNSMFGFAVAGHREAGSSWVLVGAPSAQTSQPGVIRGGAVFRCNVRKDVCEEVAFDTSGDNRNSSGSFIDQKSHQWFGATLYSSADGSAVVACAPRYIFKPIVKDIREDPVGTCYVARDNFQHFSEYSPCRTSEWGYHRQGSCQAGLSASISKDGRQLFIGAPGSRYWQGQIYSQNLHRRPEVYSTGEGPATDDDSYLGYSVAVGNFAGDGSTSAAVGRPRGNQLVGKVLIYTWNLTLMYEISGEQLGAYFGYSLCAADLDGDGFDDLVVGTPLYTDLHNNEGKYETGRIYVFYQYKEYEVNHTRDGKNSKARFGLSLTSLGDLNKDGYDDIAVGAPYDGLGGRGAVYIYMGSKNGIMEKYSQVLRADDFSGSLSTFGFSVSAGLDMDENEYPDLVIGAYETNMAFMFRARPVVKMKASVTFTTESKFITLEQPNCTVRNGLPAICTSVNICLEYSGIGTENNQEVVIKVTLDAAKPRNPRMFFRRNEYRSTMTFPLTLTKNSLFCEIIEVFIEANIRDKLTSLVAEMSYALKKQEGNQASYTTNYRRITRHLQPILDSTQELTEKDSLDIFKNCGKENICIPDLKVEADTKVKTFLLGSREQFKLHVHVHNKGDDAFEATYYLKIPLGLSYININRTEEEKRSGGVPVLCMPPANQSLNILKCDIGNPLPKNKHVGFTVLMQPFYTEGLRSQYEFSMLVNSTNPENESTQADNIYDIQVPISIQTDFNIMGASEPHEVYWSAANYTKEKFTHEEDIGPSLTYIHAILNKGPADIVEANVFFMLPNETLTGDTILYLLEQPVTTGPIRCEEVNANPLKLALEHKDGMTFTENWKESSSSSASSSSSSQIGSDGSFITSEYGSVNEGSTGHSGSHIHVESTGGHISSGSSSGKFGGGSTSGESGNGQTSGGNWAGGSLGAGGNAGGEAWENQGGSRHLYGLYGQTNEGGRVLHRDEGLISTGTNDGAFGQGVMTSHGTQHYENSSAWSNWTKTHSGADGSKTLTSSHYNASWSENGGPLHQFSNYSTSGLGEEHGREHQDWEHGNTFSGSGSDSHRHGGGRVIYNSTRNHHSSHSSEGGSGSAGGYSQQGVRYNEESNRGRGSAGSEGSEGSVGSVGSRGTFRHYTTDLSGGSQGGLEVSGRQGFSSSSSGQWSGSENVIGTDNVDESRRMEEDGQYGNLGHSKIKHHSWSQSGDNADTVNRHGSSGQEGSHQGSRTTIHYHATDNVHNGDADGHVIRHGSNRGNYGTSSSSRTNIRQYTSQDWDSRNSGDSQYRGADRGSGYSGSWHYSSGSRLGEGDGRVDGLQGSSREATRKYTTQSSWNDNVDANQYGDVDLSYAATGEYARTGVGHQGSSSGSHHYSSSSRSGSRLYDGWHNSNVDADSHNRYPSDKNDYNRKDQDSYSQSSYSSNQEVDGDSGRLKHYKRFRRDTVKVTLDDLLQCNATKCIRISCVMGPLTKGQEVRVELRTRVWIPTMKKLSSNNRVVRTSSLMAFEVTTLPYIGAPREPMIRGNEIFTDINLTDSPAKPEVVPLWVVVLSAVAGAIILLLIIYLLWMCGFFKRNRPSDAAEKEPLNRNGHYSAGDEAL
ncbi:integrin alpha-PS2 isoform X2 [Anabrus simplex]|uniref:integrin alpha-PS2 isoform X2 n=1 Tax=Anabrus simplex TaxID=316456 RepID=UPI0035A34E4F